MHTILRITLFYVCMFFSVINFSNGNSSTYPIDDRVPSNVKSIGRLRYLGIEPDDFATGFLTSTGWCVSSGVFFSQYIQKYGLTDGGGMIMEFNVPLSDPNGTPSKSTDENTYHINFSSLEYGTNTGESTGNDWAVFCLYPNTKTGKTIFQSQKVFFRIIGFRLYNGGDMKMISNAGYGVIGSPPGFGVAASPRNKYSSTLLENCCGTVLPINVHEQSESTVLYSFMTQGMNQGSPIYLAYSKVVYAIHNSFNTEKCIGVGSTFLDYSDRDQTNLYESLNRPTFTIPPTMGQIFNFFVDNNNFTTVTDGMENGKMETAFSSLQRALDFIQQNEQQSVSTYVINIVSRRYPIVSGIKFPQAGKGFSGKIFIGAVAGKVNFYGYVIPHSSAVSKKIPVQNNRLSSMCVLL